MAFDAIDESCVCVCVFGFLWLGLGWARESCDLLVVSFSFKHGASQGLMLQECVVGHEQDHVTIKVGELHNGSLED